MAGSVIRLNPLGEWRLIVCSFLIFHFFDTDERNEKKFDTNTGFCETSATGVAITPEWLSSDSS